MKRWMYGIALLVVVCTMPTAYAQMAIGSWRDCLDNSIVYRLQTVDDYIFAAARGDVFRFNTDTREVDIYSKSWGLSDVGVKDIGFDSDTRSLLIAYNNSNIDILRDSTVYNLPDIKLSSIADDRSINGICFKDARAYLSTAFGVVVVDLLRHEIIETYYIGSGGTSIDVYDLAFTSDSIYAATAEGLKRVSVTERHLAISDRWQTDARLDGVTVTRLAVLDDRLWLSGYTDNSDSNTLYVLADTGFAAIDKGTIEALHEGGGMMNVSYLDRVTRHRADFSAVDTFYYYDGWADMAAFDAVTDSKGTLWAAHTWIGLICVNSTAPYFLTFNSPRSVDNVFRLVAGPNSVLLCPGGHKPTYENAYIQPGFFVAEGLHWRQLDNSNGAFDNKYDVVDAVVNPKDTAETLVVFWGYNGGVASVRGNKVVEFYDQNTTGGAMQQYVTGDYRTLLTGAATFDRDGNLWVLNSHSPYALVRRSTNGSWSHRSTEALSSQLQVDKLIYDSINNFFWFSGRENMIYVHDGNSRMARVNPNNGSKLFTEVVNCLVQDYDGNIWIGTNKGIKVIYDASRAFAGGSTGQMSPVSCSNITITNGDFYEYLMAYEDVMCIAVDGANRKWVGTSSGGLYLLSPNGMEQLQHFTAANSPLFSDKIISVAVQPRTGEVYIGTDCGVQVYRSTATYAEATPDEHIYAFPNPVRPGYEGNVAIKGFTRNALVHVTDAAGHVVFTTQAFGGQAIWNTRTSDGDLVASGVYYVFASDAEGSNRSVAKILIMR